MKNFYICGIFYASKSITIVPSNIFSIYFIKFSSLFFHLFGNKEQSIYIYPDVSDNFLGDTIQQKKCIENFKLEPNFSVRIKWYLYFPSTKEH